jgi:hypothetical protein
VSELALHYVADGPTLDAYLASNGYLPDPRMAPFRKSFACIQGPVRSGKSVASIVRLYLAMMNVPVTQGKRRSRWLVVRNSYPDLQQSTIKTWLEWFPEELYGEFKWTPPYKHIMRFGDVEAEVVFESFAGEDDIPSLKSREYTGVWINEGQFYSRRLVIALYERTGWFPIPGGPKWLQMDMNAPPLGHWVPMMRGDTPIPEELTDSDRRALRKPDDWCFLVQPAWFTEKLDAQGRVDEYVINPEAENLRIVGERAVYELLDGRTQDEIDADLMNRVTILTSGRPVFPMFRRETHVSKVPLEPMPGLRVYVGLDFGRRPAAAFAQQSSGRWFVFDELTAENMSATEFAPIVKRRCAQIKAQMGGEANFDFWGDPSGSHARGETDDKTSFEVFEANGMKVRKADNRGLRGIRIETFTRLLNAMAGGLPKVLISPKCVVIVTGCAGGYVYRRKKVSGSPTYEDEPHKNEFSHPIDGMLEIFMGAGEAMETIGRERKGIVHTQPRTDLYGRPLKRAGGRR